MSQFICVVIILQYKLYLKLSARNVVGILVFGQMAVYEYHMGWRGGVKKGAMTYHV